MKSGAGWYIGQEVYDQEGKYWVPYQRLSHYFYSEWEPSLILHTSFNEEDISTIPSDKLAGYVAEIEEELIKAGKTKHRLIKKRIEFLERCREYLSQGMMPGCWWNYAVDATPTDAIIWEE